METLDKVDLTGEPQRILLYGAPKTGKTVAAAMLATHFNIVFIDMENGVSALVNNVPAELKPKINVIRLRDSMANPVAVSLLPEILSGKLVRICDKHSKKMCMDCRKDPKAKYVEIELGKLGTDTVVVLDSFTQLTDSVVGKVTEDLKLEDKLEFDHWGEIKRRLGRLLSTMQVLQCHLLATSHEQIVTLPNKTEKLSPTLGSRNTSREVGRYFDHLVRMEIKGKEFKSYSKQETNMSASVGTRSNLDLTDPNFKLVDLLLGKVGESLSSPAVANLENKTDVLGKPNRVLSSK